MIKNTLLFFGVVAFVLFWTQTLQARFGSVDTGAVKHPVVVELFTSQSCSSCPPADRLLGELSQNENIIPLAFHVTYWNHLHWKDTLSQQFATNRQRGYSSHRNSRRVYTPQMIVNGDREFVGSNSGTLNSALRSAKKVAPIEVTKESTNTIEINLPQLRKDGQLNYTVRLFGIKERKTVQIQRGENRGREVTYHNAVVYEQSLGPWIGQTDSRIVTLPSNPNIDHYVVLAQKGGFGEIVGAGKLK